MKLTKKQQNIIAVVILVSVFAVIGVFIVVGLATGTLQPSYGASSSCRITGLNSHMCTGSIEELNSDFYLQVGPTNQMLERTYEATVEITIEEGYFEVEQFNGLTRYAAGETAILEVSGKVRRQTALVVSINGEGTNLSFSSNVQQID